MTEKTDISLNNDVASNDASFNEYFINNPKFKLMGNFTINIQVKDSETQNTYPFYLYTREMYELKSKSDNFDTRPVDASRNTMFYVPIYSKIYDFSNNKYSALEPFKDFIVPPMTDTSYNKLNALEKINYKLNLLKNQNDTKQLTNKFMDKKAPETYKLQFTKNEYNYYKQDLFTLYKSDMSYCNIKPFKNKEYTVEYNALGVINELIINNKNATFLYKSNNKDKWEPHYIKDIKFVCDASCIEYSHEMPTDITTNKNKDILRTAKTQQKNFIQEQNKKKLSNALDDKEKAQIISNSEIKAEILDEYYTIVNNFLFSTDSNTKYTLPEDCTNQLFTIANQSTFKTGKLFFVNISNFKNEFNEIKNLSYDQMGMDLSFQQIVCKNNRSFIQTLDSMLEMENNKYVERYTKLNETKNISVKEREKNQEFINAFEFPVLKYNVIKILKTTLCISKAKKNNIKYNSYKFTIVVNDKDLIPLPEISTFKKLFTKDGFNQFKLQCSTKKNETYSKSQEELFKKCEKLCKPLPGQTDCSYNTWCNICNNYIWCVYGKEIKNNCTPNIDVSTNVSPTISLPTISSPTTGIVSATGNALKTIGNKFLDSLTIKTPPPEISNSNSSDVLIYGNPPISST